MKNLFLICLLCVCTLAGCKKDPDPVPVDDYATVQLNSGKTDPTLTAAMLGSATKIRITGTLNQKDFAVLRAYASLQYLDLSGATVVGPVVVGYRPDPGGEPLVVDGNAIPYGAFGQYIVIDEEGVTTTIPAHENIKSVIFPSNLACIGRYAFHVCLSLTEPLVFPASLTSIMDSAFERCENLTGELKFPDNIEVIGNSSFSQCISLTGTLVIPPKIETLFIKAFMGCSGFTGLRLNENLTMIGHSACSGMEGLTSLVLPAKLEAIDYSAFQGCENLRGSLTLPETLEEIGDRAFVRCGFDGTLTINKNLAKIQDYAFDDANFKSIVFPWKTEAEILFDWSEDGHIFPANFIAANKKPEYIIYIPVGTTELYKGKFPGPDGDCYYNIKEGEPK